MHSIVIVSCVIYVAKSVFFA